MQPSHTSDITHRAFQLYPGINQKEQGETCTKLGGTWGHWNQYRSVTSLNFGKTFRSKQLRRTPSPFIKSKNLAWTKTYWIIPTKFPDVSEMVKSAKTFLAGMVSHGIGSQSLDCLSNSQFGQSFVLQKQVKQKREQVLYLLNSVNCEWRIETRKQEDEIKKPKKT